MVCPDNPGLQAGKESLAHTVPLGVLACRVTESQVFQALKATRDMVAFLDSQVQKVTKVKEVLQV